MSEEEKVIKAFKYWVDINTEQGVSAIPEQISNNAVKLIEEQQKEIRELKHKLKINKDNIKNNIKEFKKMRKNYDVNESSNWGEFNHYEWISYFIEKLEELLEN